MPTSQDLVPNGLPYGERQQTVEGYQQAGVPTATTPAGSRSPVRSVATGPAQPGPSGPPVSGLELLRGRTPGDFPFIGGEQAGSPPSSEPDSVVNALGASAQSSFAKAVIARLQTKR